MQRSVTAARRRGGRPSRVGTIPLAIAAAIVAALTICAPMVHAQEALTLHASYGVTDGQGAFIGREDGLVALEERDGAYSGRLDMGKVKGDDVSWSFYRRAGDVNFDVRDFSFDPQSGTLVFPESLPLADLEFELASPDVGGTASGAGGLQAQSAVEPQADGVPKTVYYRHGHAVDYGLPGGRSTHTYSVTTASGDSLTAYCVNPPKGWVSEQDLHTATFADFKPGIKDPDMLAMVLYFGVGGPGYEKSIWPDMPDTYFGSNCDSFRERVYCCVHVLASLATFDDASMAYDQCSSAFKSWFKDKVLGDTVSEMKKRWAELPRALRTMYRESCFMLDPTNLDGKHDDAQELAVAAAELPAGYVELVKKSGNSKLVAQNSCYSLKGAVYGIFESKSKAASHKKGDAVDTATTDADGKAAFSEALPVGTYYVSEISASSGYRRDDAVYEVEVESGKTKKVNGSKGVSETPAECAFDLLLAKTDDTLARAQAQGQASLAGAQFTVNFYGGHYDAAKLPSAPLRTWVFKTDAEGRISFKNASSHKVSGDALYKNDDGQPTLPLGTVSITETKAPLGYNLKAPASESAKTYVFQVVRDDSAAGGAAVKPLNYSAPLTESSTPYVPETVMRGDYCLVKEVPVEISEDAPQEQERKLVAGVQFQIISECDNPVVSPQTGEEVASGEEVCTIVTDRNGFASTRAGADVNGWAIPAGWSGALAYGSYRVHEVIPDEVQEKFRAEYGTDMIAVQDWKLSIGAEGQYDAAQLVNNKIAQSPLKVVKIDAETGVQIPLPVSFQLFDEAGELVTYTARYPEEQVMDTWTSNAKGELTLPFLLPGGNYAIKEVQAPDGYVLSDEELSFCVDDYRSWDDPIVVEFADVPIKGVIELEKSCELDGSAVAGAQYAVVAAADIVTPEGTVRKQAGETVAVIVTDQDGRAATPELYPGIYTLYETKAPEGHALDVDEHSIAVEPEGQDVPVVRVHAGLTDAATTMRILKTDAESGEPLAQAAFTIERVEEDASEENAQEAEGGQGEAGEPEEPEEHDEPEEPQDREEPTGEAPAAADLAESGQEEEEPAEGEGNPKRWDVLTDDEGAAEIAHLGHGLYRVVEVEAPEGYHVRTDDELLFRVNDQGLIGFDGGPFADVLEICVENERNEIGTSASVGGAKSAVAQGTLTITDVVSYKGCKPGASYTGSGTLHRVVLADGELADGGPLVDAKGKPVSATATFTASGREGAVEVVFSFDADLAGPGDLVAFEEMYEGEKLFAVHADITDEGQTVTLTPPDAGKSRKPKIGTSAKDGSDGDKQIDSSGKVTVVDTVAYSGLTAGEKYIVEGTMHIVKEDKHGMVSDGGLLLDKAGKAVRAKTIFTAKKAKGHVKVKFEFDADGHGGEKLVVFEELYKAGGKGASKPLAKHADITSQPQTVEVVKRTPTAPTPEKLPSTGDMLARFWWLAAVVVAASLVVCSIVLVQVIRARRA